MTQSLFGHLAHNFSAHPENLATEALAYVLNRSRVAMDALGRFCATTGATIPSELYFQTQAAGEDNAIPDLVGVTKDNEQAVIVEAKFWAELTVNQPVTYLNRGPRLLVFLSPTRRIPTIWAELLTRCKIGGFEPQPRSQAPQGVCVAQLSATQFLAACTWRAVLDYVLCELSAHGDHDSISDIRQLQGLCDRMDTEAFLPIRAEELSPAIAIRSLQFNEVVDILTDMLVERKMAVTTGLRSTATNEGYGRYMRVGGFGWQLQVNTRYWSSVRETPFWLNVKSAPNNRDWTYSPEARERLSALEIEMPSRLIRESNNLLIPLTIPIGVERSQVIERLFEQLREVFELLQPTAGSH